MSTAGSKNDKQSIKKAMREIPLLCANCHRAEPAPGVFKRCGNCKNQYCSKECQKADWPQHKAGCRLQAQSATQIELTKRVQTILANDALRRYIEVLLVLELDLINNPSGADKIYHTEIVVDFEPEKVQDFKALFRASAVIDSSPLRGMLQIGAIGSENCDNIPWENISRETIDQMREEISRERNDVVWLGAVQWLRDVGGHVSFANTIVYIIPKSIECARKNVHLDIPVYRAPSGNDITVRKPAGIFTYIELINALIRQDTKNRWLLRVNLTAEDKRLIQYAAANQPAGDRVKLLSKGMFLNIWMHKALREAVFDKKFARFAERH